MHRKGLAICVCFLCSLAGCFLPEPVRSTSWMPPSFSSAKLQANLVQLDVALLERPVGDSFLNKELWNCTDEQVVALEEKAAVDDNGYRVGQIIGLPPGRLQNLLTSERSCINPRRRLIPSGRPAAQFLGPTLAHTAFQVKLNGDCQKVALDQAQFLLEVTPTMTGDGRITLRFTPKIQYGETLPEWQPSPQSADWSFQLSRPSKSFPALNWEVTLKSNSYLVVGASFEHPGTLGYTSFIHEEGKEPVQRLLVIRAIRPGDGQGPIPTLEEMARKNPSPPLALQATMSAVRAQGQ